MKAHWEHLATEQQDGFEIQFSITPEDMHPADSFDASSFADEDGLQNLIQAIDDGELCWFVARVQAFKNGILLATDCLGGNCYEDPLDFISDSGYYDDMKSAVIEDAKKVIKALAEEITA